MSETMKKPEKDESRETRSLANEPSEAERRKLEYYYDDAHGYETYIPDDEDEPSESN